MYHLERYVTPCVGVWIEICNRRIYKNAQYVTPCVGVWIEIISKMYRNEMNFCHSLRGSVD